MIKQSVFCIYGTRPSHEAG